MKNTARYDKCPTPVFCGIAGYPLRRCVEHKARTQVGRPCRHCKQIVPPKKSKYDGNHRFGGMCREIRA